VLGARVRLGSDVLLEEAVAVAERFRRLATSHGYGLWYGTASACAIAGLVEEARQALTAGLDVLRSYPNRLSMLPGAFRLAEAALRIDQIEPLPFLYELLRPYDDRVAVLGEGAAVLGPVALVLGELAIAIDDREAAEEHVRLSHEIADRMRSLPWSARTLVAEARLLRAGAGEQAALQPLAQARKIAEELGMTRLLAEIDAQTGTRPRKQTDAPLPVVLRRDGEHWAVMCGEATARLRDSKGLRYLADLIAHPGVERHVFDLVTLTEGGADAEVDRHQLGDAGPLLDAQAKGAYKRRLSELREDLEDATVLGDDDTVAKAQAEIDALVAELARAVGLGGRDRRAASAAEKARLNVTRALRSAIARIGEAHPRLGAHLDRTVRTGTFCSYQPASYAEVAWQR